MTKHEINACRMFLADFPEYWSFDRVLHALEEETHEDANRVVIWNPLRQMARDDLSATIYDAAKFLSAQYGGEPQ